MREAQYITDMLTEGNTALCNRDLWACFLAEPAKIFNTVMGGLAFVILTITFSILLWKALHD